ncbi:MAG: alkaline phosphatase [Kofleriaceae bacterium]|nr:alkaline phosphatase [Kofleriaceae bacterium]MBP9168939.1 alkaline phosphatase [Kofleriaceae bacterium]MBP9859648.1 alkaline phosphatase [Kofleriaceae bacterium]
MAWRALLLAAALAACGDDRRVAPEDASVDAAEVDAALVDAADPDAAVADADARGAPPPAVILLIGDGMGQGALDAASYFRHGARERLAMQGLAYRGQVRTGGPSGTTDSAAAATVMATGVYTVNGAIGVDRAGRPVETLIERAHARGWSTGVVTTTSLPHATPAGFTAHVASRAQLVEIADAMVATHPDVMLGGGSLYFAPAGTGSVRTDDGLHDELDLAGYTRVATAAELAAAVAAGAPRIFGAFAPDQMTYVAARPADTVEPGLRDMALAALTTLDRDPHGMFVMIEGGRIDHGGHANSLTDVIAETLAFDDTVAAVVGWARARGNTTVLVTADHECGGLEVTAPAPAGQPPPVRWRWGNHTNARVAVFADGPGAGSVDGAVIDHRWIYAIARARMDRGAMIIPGREPIPDGELTDLRHRAVVQRWPTDFGVGYNQLDALWLDATADGLFVGIEGLFEWGENAVEIWIDVDPGAGTGPASPAGSLTDPLGLVDRLLGATTLTAGAVDFAPDVAIATVGGLDPHVEDLWDDAGARGLRPPLGRPDDLGWLRAAINFGAVRTRERPSPPVPGQGLEVRVPWTSLYPGGVVPVGARVRLAAVLVDASGGYASNQFLPPLPVGGPGPGAAPVVLPGVVEYVLDANGDGFVDGDRPPSSLP